MKYFLPVIVLSWGATTAFAAKWDVSVLNMKTKETQTFKPDDDNWSIPEIIIGKKHRCIMTKEEELQGETESLRMKLFVRTFGCGNKDGYSSMVIQCNSILPPPAAIMVFGFDDEQFTFTIKCSR